MERVTIAISAEGRVRSMVNWKETKCGKCKIQRKRPVCNSCFSYDKFIPIAITNADRIRSMNDEELSEFLIHVETLGYTDSSVSGKLEMIEWLQSKVEE